MSFVQASRITIGSVFPSLSLTLINPIKVDVDNTCSTGKNDVYFILFHLY